MKKPGYTDIEIAVEHGNVLSVPADVLALKYADKLHGADRAAVQALDGVGRDITGHLPEQSEFYIAPGRGATAAEQILFLGVGPLRRFGYKEIRNFGRRVLETLAGETPEAAHVALTIHGPGYGLDEAESFKSEIAGLYEAIRKGTFPTGLERITVVEANAARARRLETILKEVGGGASSRTKKRRKRSATATDAPAPDPLESTGYDSQNKPHIFVAMPFAEEMDDVFHYGIQGAVNAAGYLCERADLSSFTGDVIEWVKQRIASASLVIADLSDANPNVYLEVGYAWGRGRPTVLIVNDTADLKFDVRGQRCLAYRKIKDLENLLRNELVNLKGTIAPSGSGG